MTYIGNPAPLPRRIPGATFHRPAATTLPPQQPDREQAQQILAALAADRDDDSTAHRTLGGMDAWGRPHAHSAF